MSYMGVVQRIIYSPPVSDHSSTGLQSLSG